MNRINLQFDYTELLDEISQNVSLEDIYHDWPDSNEKANVIYNNWEDRFQSDEAKNEVIPELLELIETEDPVNQLIEYMHDRHSIIPLNDILNAIGREYIAQWLLGNK